MQNIYAKKHKATPKRLINIIILLYKKKKKKSKFNIVFVSPKISVQKVGIATHALIIIVVFFKFVYVTLLNFFKAQHKFQPLPSLSLPIFFLYS